VVATRSNRSQIAAAVVSIGIEAPREMLNHGGLKYAARTVSSPQGR
jgi:hypothetical protein